MLSRNEHRVNGRALTTFRREVWNYWKKHGRHDLAWRKTKDPYKILVSEVMLQQTQVPRVSEKYGKFLKKFPNTRALARAKLVDVLRIWSGMGYNRRAKYLHDAAKIIVEKHGGKVPRDFAALRTLPGVGPYTASAIRVFAFNEPDTLIETNIRAAFIHHFYSSVLQKTAITDGQILPIAKRAAEGNNPPAGGPRKWHWALMDYGAYLKRSGVRNNHRSAHYVRPSKFEGSLRQIRGAILRTLTAGPKTDDQIYRPIRANRPVVNLALAGLARDGLIVKKKGAWRIA
jgi:A/G-specific adenine glycosylase